MKIEVENTLEDFVLFNHFHFANSPSFRQSSIIMRYGVSGIILLLPLILLGTEYFATAVAVGAVVGIAYFFLWPGTMRKSVEGRVRKMYAEDNNKGSLGRHLMEFSDDGIFVENEYQELKVRWNSINKIVSDERNIYVYNSAVTAFVIPKRFFKSDADVTRFVDRIQAMRDSTV